MEVISRCDAQRRGLKRYFLGLACVHGHVAERFVSNKGCLTCVYTKNEAIRKANPKLHAVRNRTWATENKGKLKRKRQTPEYKAKRKVWRSTPRAQKTAKLYAVGYESRNRTAIIANASVRMKRYRELGTQQAIASRLRTRLNSALRQSNRAGSAVRDLGCSIGEFRIYIEAKFSGEMSWENCGAVWELDHIEPLGLFDLSNREEFLCACRYTNYQPLLIPDHVIKTISDNDRIRRKRRGHPVIDQIGADIL